MTRPIIAIFGVDPCRQDEFPTAHVVGSASWAPGGAAQFTPTRIERREENFGDHGLLWFDVFDGDSLAASMQGRAVAEIHYGPEEGIS